MKKIISPVPTDELEFLGGILVDNSSRQLAMKSKTLDMDQSRSHRGVI